VLILPLFERILRTSIWAWKGDIEDLAGLNLFSPHARANISNLGPGKYALKAITEAGSERVIRHAFELARPA